MSRVGKHDGMRTSAVHLVLFEGVQSLDVTGPLEVFAGANQWQRAQGREPAYTLTTASLGGAAVRTSSGLQITPDRDLSTLDPPDLLVVPGGQGTRQPSRALIDWLAKHGPAAARIASVCTGAFLLAEAGLLAGRRATTHWSYCDVLAERFPDIQVESDPIYILDGDLATSAGVTSGIDLALALVEQHLGRAAALDIARHLVVFLRRPGSQAQFSVQLANQFAEREPLRELQQWMTEHPEADLSIDALAARANLSPRHFTRAFAAEVGVSPGRYVDQLRLEAARRRLEDSDDDVGTTARHCGFGTPEAMRRAFLRSLGVGPADYRRRFQTRQIPTTMENHADRDPVV